MRHAEIEQIAFERDTFAVENIEFRFAERRRHFVLHHFSSRARAHDAIAFFDGLNAADVQANGSIEFQGSPAGGCFWIAKHHTDFFADLVNED